jgi:hypothetical protein
MPFGPSNSSASGCSTVRLILLRPSRVLRRRRAMSGGGCSVRAIWILTPHDTIAFSRYPLELLSCQDLTLLTPRGSPVSLVSAGGSRSWRSGGAPRGRRMEEAAWGMGRVPGRRCRPTTRSPPPLPNAGEGSLSGGLACYFRWFRCVKSVANYL